MTTSENKTRFESYLEDGQRLDADIRRGKAGLRIAGSNL